MQEIKEAVSVEIDPKDISIDCRTASAYCTRDLSCFDCPFSRGSLSLDEIIHMYMVLRAAEVNNAAD
jgi:hypothetical protein